MAYHGVASIDAASGPLPAAGSFCSDPTPTIRHPLQRGGIGAPRLVATPLYRQRPPRFGYGRDLMRIRRCSTGSNRVAPDFIGQNTPCAGVHRPTRDSGSNALQSNVTTTA